MHDVASERITLSMPHRSRVFISRYVESCVRLKLLDQENTKSEARPTRMIFIPKQIYYLPAKTKMERFYVDYGNTKKQKACCKGPLHPEVKPQVPISSHQPQWAILF